MLGLNRNDCHIRGDGAENHSEAVFEIFQFFWVVDIHLFHGVPIQCVWSLLLCEVEDGDFRARHHGILQGHVAQSAETCNRPFVTRF